jgi:hypothetical protein
MTRRSPPRSRPAHARKQRRTEQLQKNRRDEELFNIMRLRQAEAKRVKALDDARWPTAAGTPAGDPAVDKVAVIRHRLTGKKRVSRERWNRFTATGDAGGRGL